MIPKELLKALRKIEITTNRLATEQLSGNYTSVFKGQGPRVSRVREYQPATTFAPSTGTSARA
jgi:hypothetical protein